MTDEFQRTLDLWCDSMLRKDGALADRLRDDSYVAKLPMGDTLTRDQERAMIEGPAIRITSARIEESDCDAVAGTGHALLHCAVEANGQMQEYTLTIAFRLHDGTWRAHHSTVSSDAAAVAPTVRKRSRLRDWFRRRLYPTFQETAYLPYQPGEDFALPRSARPARVDLPIPPRHLWLGYNYPMDGKRHVDAMLSILHASDFAFRPGDRVLDFGCGAGRMIRHLLPLASTCEVWGTDISAEHIYWARRHMTPPFRFATTTKVPHLPFEDRSFRFIYCGSVFTHIDDMADAWLLELRRLLAPDGRLYVTIHDNQTIELMESGRAQWLQWIQKRKVYQRSKGSFDFMTIGRDDGSQVFYDRDYFLRMLEPNFDVLSITPEAYHYQTAYLLQKR